MIYIIRCLKNAMAAAAVCVALAAWASSGYSAPYPQSDSDITKGEIRNFDQYLDNHPEVARQLQQNPSLVDRKDYLEDHPQLRDWLRDHPEAREELRENPSAFMKDERRFENKGGDINRTELRNFDNYLDNHPVVSKQLNRNPSLINNEDYMEKHPELREWMNNHPYARQELKENPRAFMHREKQFDKREGPEPTARQPQARAAAMPRPRQGR